MLWIGVTGPIGSGKSTVSEWLRTQGFPVLDADQVVHHVLSPGGPVETEIFKIFGSQVKAPDGALDRRALGRVVFADPLKLAQLEALTHPAVRAHVAQARQKLAAQGHAAAFYDVPLLFEKQMQSQFDHVLVVSAPEDLRRTRVMARSQLTAQEFDARMARQMPAHLKEAQASAVILNSGDLSQLEQNIKGALLKLNVPLPAATDS